MNIVLAVHILGGSIGLITGFLALFVAKGALLHRKSGMLFVYAMVAMGVCGTIIATVRGIGISMVGGILTSYFVITAFTAVRRADDRSRKIDFALFLLGLIISIITITLGVQTAATPSGKSHGVPAFIFFLQGGVGLLAVSGDARMLLAGGLQGAARIKRHLWRMCWALWIAAGSFFLGQAKVIPKPIRIFPLLVIPPLIALIAIPYWMWRMRVKGRRAITPDGRLGRLTDGVSGSAV